MKTVSVNFAKPVGAMKPMHAVNNGPVYKFASDQRITNLPAYQAAGIPFARTHDAAFEKNYGGEHTVDVIAIFPDFDKDPEDPASYDFCLTDEYLKVIRLAGTEPFFRLGNKIEHWPKKYGTLPPRDFKKWAVICEHIIRHYNYGWANGFEMGIRYWEIWNEPDLDPDDSPNKRNWGGTEKQFFELYDVAAKHLKAAFPELKIGGPALAGNMGWAKRFLTQLEAPLDFFSWHIYSRDPNAVAEKAVAVRKMLDEAGYPETESILNEWNYVSGWNGEDWIRSLKAEKGLKGAAFTASTMCACQKTPLDLLMYYDARPCAMNGMFCTDFVCECLKGYYPFVMFNTLYRLGAEVESHGDDGGWVCAAVGKGEAAVMVSRFTDDDQAAAETFRLEISGLPAKTVRAAYYLLDQERDLELVREETFATGDFASILRFDANASYLVRLFYEL